MPLLCGLIALSLCLASATVDAEAPRFSSASTQPDPAPEFNRTEKLPSALEGVGINEMIDKPMPLDLTFTDERGQKVQLGEYFKHGKPVILNLGYYGCPMLCGLVINGLVDSVRDMRWVPGQEFEIVTVSIDPSEKYPLAMAKKQSVIEALGEPAAANGWHFLTGDEHSIKTLTDAVGFGYRWDDVQQQFAHSAVIVLGTPDGRVSRYLYGVRFSAKLLRLSLVEASEGKVGSSIDKVLLFCFHYDPNVGSYSIAAMKLMRLAGFVTVLVVAGAIITMLVREFRQRHAEETTLLPRA